MTYCSFNSLNTKLTTKPKMIGIFNPRSIRKQPSTLAPARRRIGNRQKFATSSRSRSSFSGGCSNPIFRLRSLLPRRKRRKRRKVFPRLRPRCNGSNLRRIRERCCLKRNIATRPSFVVWEILVGECSKLLSSPRRGNKRASHVFVWLPCGQTSKF